MEESENVEIPDAFKKLPIQVELESYAISVREKLRGIKASESDIVLFVDENKESIVRRLAGFVEVASGKRDGISVNGNTPEREIMLLLSFLTADGPGKFLKMLVFRTETFLGAFFPEHDGLQTRRWAKGEIATADIEAFFIGLVYDALLDRSGKPRDDIFVLRLSLSEMERRLRACEYDSESQYLQLKMAEMQLELAKSQDLIAREQQSIARATENQSRRMTKMTVVIMIATLVTLVLTLVSFARSLDDGSTESLRSIDQRVSRIETAVA